MPRATISRQWTENEHSLAIQIAGKLWDNRNNPPLGSLSVARLVSLPCGLSTRERSQWKIYEVMPLVAEIIAETHPGYAAIVDQDVPGAWGTYRVTEQPRYVRTYVDRQIKIIATKTHRLAVSADPLRQSTDPDDRVRASFVDAVDNMITAMVPVLGDMDRESQAS